MMISGKARVAGVMGWPVAHSRSPRLHGHWLERYGIDGAYVPLAVAPARAAEAIRALPALGLRGCNVTVPHKEVAAATVDRLDATARRMGAVNTIVVHEDGTLEGRNTDGFGFLENLRAGTMDRWGIGYQQLREVNPKIIYIALNGFGQWGGYAEGRASYDAVAQTVSGLLATTGFPGRLPLKTGVFVGDYFGALFGALGVLSALHYRDRTGEGQFIEISQGEGLMRLLDWSWIYYHLEKYNRPRTGNRDLAICPSDVFLCKDGPVALAAGTDEQFRSLCQAMGQPELAENPRYAEVLTRLKEENAVSLLEIIAEWAKTKTVAEINKLGEEYGFASSPILNAKDQYESPHFRARASIFEYEDPILGKMTEVGSPAKLSATPGRLKWANKPVGLDNEFVLRKFLGLRTYQIQALAEKKVIGKWVEMPPGRKPPSDWDGKAGVIM